MSIYKAVLVSSVQGILLNILSRPMWEKNLKRMHMPQKANQNDLMDQALCNLMKLRAMPCRATYDRWFLVKVSDKMWSTGEKTGTPIQYSLVKNSLKIMKRK